MTWAEQVVRRGAGRLTKARPRQASNAMCMGSVLRGEQERDRDCQIDNVTNATQREQQLTLLNTTLHQALGQELCSRDHISSYKTPVRPDMYIKYPHLINEILR